MAISTLPITSFQKTSNNVPYIGIPTSSFTCITLTVSDHVALHYQITFLLLLVDSFVRNGMSQIYQFPGRCDQYNCQRDNQQCESKACNCFAMRSSTEFPHNVLREEHCLEELIVQLRYLWSYYFGIGPSIITEAEPATPHLDYLHNAQDEIPVNLSPFRLPAEESDVSSLNNLLELTNNAQDPNFPADLHNILPF